MPRQEPLRATRRYMLVLPSLLLFACGGDDGSDERSGREPDSELVAWTGELCDAAAQSVQGLPYPLSAPEATTEADRQPLLDFLTEAQTALGSAVDAADALPAAPTASARDAADAYRSDLDALAGELADYQASATALPAEALQNIYVIAGIGVVSFQPGGDEMSEYLEGHTDLADAYQQASPCSGDDETTSTTPAPSTTAGAPEEREAALLADIQATFQDQPGGDQQVLERVYSICGSLDATDPDRFYPPENLDPAQAASLAEELAGRPPGEVLDSLGRIMGNPVTVGIMARLGAEHICPHHSDAIEEWFTALT